LCELLEYQDARKNFMIENISSHVDSRCVFHEFNNWFSFLNKLQYES